MESITNISDAIVIASASQTITVSAPTAIRHYLRQCREVLPCDAHESLSQFYSTIMVSPQSAI